MNFKVRNGHRTQPLHFELFSQLEQMVRADLRVALTTGAPGRHVSRGTFKISFWVQF